jgi:hypothetical protein
VYNAAFKDWVIDHPIISGEPNLRRTPVPRILLPVLLIIFSNLSQAKETPLKIEEIYYFNGKDLKVSVITSYKTYPSNSIAKLGLKALLINKNIDANGTLQKADLELQFLQISPDADTLDDGIAQVHCKIVNIESLVSDVLESDGVKNFNKFGISISLPQGHLLWNPQYPTKGCIKFDPLSL